MTHRKTLIIVTVVVLAVAIVWVLRGNPNSNKMNQEPNSSNTTETTGAPPKDRKSPDPVKESGAPSGDTTPSGTGTGPGSDNSLLGQ